MVCPRCEMMLPSLPFVQSAKLPEVPSAEPPAAAKAKPQKVVEEEDPDMAELAAWAS